MQPLAVAGAKVKTSKPLRRWELNARNSCWEESTLACLLGQSHEMQILSWCREKTCCVVLRTSVQRKPKETPSKTEGANASLQPRLKNKPGWLGN